MLVQAAYSFHNNVIKFFAPSSCQPVFSLSPKSLVGGKEERNSRQDCQSCAPRELRIPNNVTEREDAVKTPSKNARVRSIEFFAMRRKAINVKKPAQEMKKAEEDEYFYIKSTVRRAGMVSQSSFKDTPPTAQYSGVFAPAADHLS
eukprot:TRINITY_DN323_c0_g1_i1.p1 TRINITY_DN323_c0_g1~~TRINITY_DN323_c0_g1_i1.p1  ORF type:complete len:146 (+),score=6.60 TRINITY_DN323_c0_g1_i1:698-1135(+)